MKTEGVCVESVDELTDEEKKYWKRIATSYYIVLDVIVLGIVGLVGGLLGYYFIGVKPKFVDFLIATEGEMKKVNWSTRREIMGSTWVVIGLTVVVAVLITVMDYMVYSPIFRAIGVLESGG